MSCPLVLKYITEDEARFLYLLIGKCVDAGSKEVSLTVSDYTGDVNATKDQWTKSCMDTMNDLLNVKGYEELGGGGRQYFSFFEKYRYVPETKELVYTLSDNAYYHAEDFRRDYSAEDFAKLSKLTAKYPSRIYQLLAPYKKSGFHSIELDEFYNDIEMPSVYSAKDLSKKILKPSIKQIIEIGLMENLTYRYKRSYRSESKEIIFDWRSDEEKAVLERQLLSKVTGKTSKLMDENFNSFYEW